MSRQTTLSNVDQRTLTECAVTTERKDKTPTTERDLLDQVQTHAADVTAEHFPDLPIDAITWEVSHRRQRSAGATKYDPATGEITISLAWDAFEQHRWEQFSSTVRHELIHAWQYHEFGEVDHGRIFARWTDALDTTQHCERFTSPNWWVICEECGGQLPRYQRSKVVKQPEDYSCDDCGGSFRVEEAIGTMVNLDLTVFGNQRAIPKVALVVIRHVVDRERERHLGPTTPTGSTTNRLSG